MASWFSCRNAWIAIADDILAAGKHFYLWVDQNLRLELWTEVLHGWPGRRGPVTTPPTLPFGLESGN